uniref:PiggyBac transposable element-derived protein domain-containing protein n=1 Tax=Graphocephala atropunctata TaxID=36148 RepID=A0A1B6MIG5_9HEMI
MDEDSILLGWLNEADDAYDSEDSDGPSEHDDDDRCSEVSCSDVENSGDVDNEVYMTPVLPVSMPIGSNQNSNTANGADQSLFLQNDLPPMDLFEPLQPVTLQCDTLNLDTTEYVVLEPVPSTSCQTDEIGNNQHKISRPNVSLSQTRGRGTVRGRVSKERDHAPVRSNNSRGRASVRSFGAVRKRRATGSRGARTTQPSIHQCPPMCYIGKKNRVIWNMFHTSKTTKARPQNIITKLPGVLGSARECKTIIDCWKVFFTDSMLKNIVKYTNQKLSKISRKFSRGERDCYLTDETEVSAFLGLLYIMGVKKNNHIHLDELWAVDGTAPEIFIATMSERRFRLLSQALRFDDENTRAARKKLDNLAPIRDIFDSFVKTCGESYSVGDNVTIDEMMEPFRGRCKFRMYIKNKPCKYGIKIYATVDSATFYTAYMEIYPGTQPNDSPFKMENDASSVVKRCISIIDNTGRNVTMDNFFTSIPLANDLYSNHRLTVVGTLRKDKKEIPAELLDITGRRKCSSMFAFSRPPNYCSMVSYMPNKQQKMLFLLLSTLHENDKIDEISGDDMKPEMITYYNATKGGVDVVDRLKTEYCVSRISRRWPFTVFNGLLNVGAVNASIIFKANTKSDLPRRKFLMELGRHLIRDHLLRRNEIKTLSIPTKQKIKNCLGKHEEVNVRIPVEDNATQEAGKQPKCAYCPRRKNRYTKNCCSECQAPICKEHVATTVFVCSGCSNKED